MASPLETGPGPQNTLDNPQRLIDPLHFVPLDIRRKIGLDWQDQARTILNNMNLVSNGNYHMGVLPESLVFTPPLEEDEFHKNSDGKYVFQGFLNRRETRYGKVVDVDWVGIYLLLPGKATSEHRHPAGLRERYKILRGEMTLFENGVPRVVDGADMFTIEPGNRHHSRTEDDQFALVMVIMEGAGKFPHDQMHLDSIRPEVKPDDPSPRRDAVVSLLELYETIFNGTPDEAAILLRRIKSMSHREIMRVIEIARDNPSGFKANPRYNWVVNV